LILQSFNHEDIFKRLYQFQNLMIFVVSRNHLILVATEEQKVVYQ